ncbi:MAG: tripartite tricarboxylate transporter substrate binding protein [Desulfobacterales bacterium]|nr:tripartite tricarboxylate transporter substrate binding protein [Desulfobacterales bacterium]
MYGIARSTPLALSASVIRSSPGRSAACRAGNRRVVSGKGLSAAGQAGHLARGAAVGLVGYREFISIRRKEIYMKKNRIFIVLLAALLVLSFAVSGWAAAPPKPKGYPERPIEAVVQYGAGGGTDIFVQDPHECCPQRPGRCGQRDEHYRGLGVKASNYVLEQPADGYTIYSFAPEQIINTVFGRENYRDFMPLCNVQQDETVFYVRAESPYKTIHDVLNAAKQNPGKIRMAGAMSASPDEVIAMLFAKKAGIQINYIPFDKAPESHAAVLGGHLEVLYEEPGVIMSLIEAGKLRPLLTLTETRLAPWPNVPTARKSASISPWDGGGVSP